MTCLCIGCVCHDSEWAAKGTDQSVLYTYWLHVHQVRSVVLDMQIQRAWRVIITEFYTNFCFSFATKHKMLILDVKCVCNFSISVVTNSFRVFVMLIYMAENEKNLHDGMCQVTAIYSSSAFPSCICGVHHFGRDFWVCDRFLIQQLR